MLHTLTIDTHTDKPHDIATAIARFAGLFDIDIPAPEHGDADPAVIYAANATPTPPNAFNAPAQGLAGVQLDGDNLPWDERIHAKPAKGPPTMTAAGLWKAKKGRSDEEYARIGAELRALMSLPVPNAAAAAPPPPAPAAAAAPPPPPPAAPAAAAPPPPAPAAAAAPPPPPPAAASAVASTTPTTFVQLMQWVGPYLQSAQLTQATVTSAMQQLGVVDANGTGNIGLLAQRADLVPAAYAMLAAELPAA